MQVGDDGAVVDIPSSYISAHPDVDDRTYTVRDRNGHEDHQPVTGLSMRAAIQHAEDEAGQTPDATFVTVQRNDVDASWTSPLTPADLEGQGYDDGLLPVVQVYSDQLEYYRPMRSGDAHDDNASDDVAATPDVAPRIHVVVHTGRLLHVDVSADDASVPAHHTVSFSATTDATTAEEPVKISWRFGDGDTAIGPTVRHAYAESGTYLVLADATGASKTAGQSALLSVTAGKPTPPSTAPPTSGAVPSAAAPPRRGQPSSPARTRPPEAPLTAASATRGARSGASSREPPLAGQLSRGTSDEGPVVAGQLLSGLPNGTEARRGVRPTGASPAVTSAPRWGIVIGVTAAVLLLAVGAARESRGGRR